MKHWVGWLMFRIMFLEFFFLKILKFEFFLIYFNKNFFHFHLLFLIRDLIGRASYKNGVLIISGVVSKFALEK